MTNEKVPTIKNNQKYGQRDSEKHITMTVKAYLEGFFWQEMWTKQIKCLQKPKDMFIELKKLAKDGEIQNDKMPEIKTIEVWNTRYSASLRKELAEQRVMGKTNKSLEKEDSNSKNKL